MTATIPLERRAEFFDALASLQTEQPAEATPEQFRAAAHGWVAEQGLSIAPEQVDRAVDQVLGNPAPALTLGWDRPQDGADLDRRRGDLVTQMEQIQTRAMWAKRSASIALVVSLSLLIQQLLKHGEFPLLFWTLSVLAHLGLSRVTTLLKNRLPPLQADLAKLQPALLSPDQREINLWRTYPITAAYAQHCLSCGTGILVEDHRQLDARAASEKEQLKQAEAARKTKAQEDHWARWGGG